MSMRHLLQSLAAVAFLLPAVARTAVAQSGPACPPAAGANDQVAALVARFPQGGGGLTATIAGLVALQPESAASVIAVARCSSSAISGALGAGLAQGAVLLATTDPAATAQIRDAGFQVTEQNFAIEFGVALTVALAENTGAQVWLQRGTQPSQSFVAAEFGIAYSAALAVNAAAQVSLQPANSSGNGFVQPANQVSPN